MAILVEGEYTYKQVHESGVLNFYVKRSGGAFSGNGVKLLSSGLASVITDIQSDFAAAASNIFVGVGVAVSDNDAATTTQISAYYDANTGDVIFVSQTGLAATSQIEFFASFIAT